MTINPKTRESYLKTQAKEIEAVWDKIRRLPPDVRHRIQEGIVVIEGHLDFQKKISDIKNPLIVTGLNVFNLTHDIPGDVMKHLAMLYVAAGFRHVSIGCEGYISEGTLYVKHPNSISFSDE